MNKKESNIDKILAIVVDECTMTEDLIIKSEEVRGKCKKENVCMTRAIFVTEMVFAGYSVTTIATYLHKTEQAVSDILNAAHQYRISSWAYRVAEAESTLKCKELMATL